MQVSGRTSVTVINKKNIATSDFDADALSTTTLGEPIINFGDLSTSGDLANFQFAPPTWRLAQGGSRRDSARPGGAGGRTRYAGSRMI
jgi:hypothetical protein